MENIFGPFGDPQFWKDVGSNAIRPVNTYDRLATYGQQLREIPGDAADMASQALPSDTRNSGTQNALRHSLGTGMLTQALGGGPVAAAMAKAGGYVWEARDMLGGGMFDKNIRTDSRHDLNANAVGASMGQRTTNPQELLQALKQMALSSALVKEPPGVFQSSPGYLTRTEQ